jgi:hypothetical protein
MSMAFGPLSLARGLHRVEARRSQRLVSPKHSPMIRTTHLRVVPPSPSPELCRIAHRDRRLVTGQRAEEDAHLRKTSEGLP